MTNLEARVRLIEFQADKEWQHVVITDTSRCRECANKPCLAVCPSGVFRRDDRPDGPVAVLYRQCVECGACRLACGQGNIAFAYPHGGQGVIFHEG